MTPTAVRWERASSWACALGTYCSSATARSTRARSSSVTSLLLPLMMRDAVAWDTPARLATSASVATGAPFGYRGCRHPNGMVFRKALTWEGASVSRIPIGIVVNGVTGRMGYRQHLVRSLLAIREQGGLPTTGGDTIWPEPVLVGRSEAKLADIAAQHGLSDWTTDLDEALRRSDIQVYFDAQVTQQREKAIKAALEAGKHVYTEKPLAETLDGA